MDYEIMRIRIVTMQEEISKLLAANAAYYAMIDKLGTKIAERLDILEEDMDEGLAKQQ